MGFLNYFSILVAISILFGGFSFGLTGLSRPSVHSFDQLPRKKEKRVVRNGKMETFEKLSFISLMSGSARYFAIMG
jgi:hypothetical protein